MNIRTAMGLALAAALMATRLPAHAQAPAFDSISIKPNRSGGIGQDIRITPDGSYVLTNATAMVMIRQAFRVQVFQVADAPGWVNTDRFDVTAKAPTGSNPDALPLMVQRLLEERFKLRAHREMREMPVYALVPARRDGQLGPQIRPTPAEAIAQCEAQRRSVGAAGRSDGRPCGISISGPTVRAGNARLGTLLGLLAPQFGRTALDRTGLEVPFDFDLRWTPDQLANRATPGTVNGVEIDPNGPSLFTAFQEQLGLRLESERAPVDVLVIDAIEQPTEN